MSECRIHLTALKRPVIPKGAGKSLGNGHNSDTMLFENVIDTSWAFFRKLLFVKKSWNIRMTPMPFLPPNKDYNTSITEAGTVNIKSYSNPDTWHVEQLFGRIVILFSSYHPDHLSHELHLGIYNTCQYYNKQPDTLRQAKYHFISGTCCLENSQSIAEWSIQAYKKWWATQGRKELQLYRKRWRSLTTDLSLKEPQKAKSEPRPSKVPWNWNPAVCSLALPAVPLNLKSSPQKPQRTHPNQKNTYSMAWGGVDVVKWVVVFRHCFQLNLSTLHEFRSTVYSWINFQFNIILKKNIWFTMATKTNIQSQSYMDIKDIENSILR